MRVNQAFVEAEWETKKDQFPGVEISFSDADDAGMAELEVEGATPEVVAAAVRAERVSMSAQKPERPAVAADFIDHGQERLLTPRSTDKKKEVGAGTGSTAVETEPAAKKKSTAKKK